MSNDVDLTECRQCLCQAARVEAQRLTRMFDVRLRPFDLTINQFSLLATLVLAGPQTVTRLAGRLGIDRTTLTRNLSLAERRDLVTTSRERGQPRAADRDHGGRTRAGQQRLPGVACRPAAGKDVQVTG